MNRLNQTESAVFKLPMLYFPRLYFHSEIKKKNESAISAAYVDFYLYTDIGELSIRPNNKIYGFDFPNVNLPFLAAILHHSFMVLRPPGS